MSISSIMSVFPGAEVQVTLTPRLIDDPRLLARARGLMRKQVASCECGGDHVIPARAKFTVLTTTPIEARPLKLWRALLGKAGFDPDDDVAYLSMTCQAEIVEWTEAVGNEFVMLLGESAVTWWRRDVAFEDVRGGMFVWRNQRVVMPTFHPNELMQSKRGLRGWLMRDLATWRGFVSGELDWDWGLGGECVTCRSTVDAYDRDGVPYCKQHIKKGLEAWSKAHTRKKTKEARGQEDRLL